MPDENTKPDPRAEAKAKMIAAQAARRSEIAQRLLLIGREFTPNDPKGLPGVIVNYFPDRNMAGISTDALVVNFGHPNCDPIISFEAFNQQYTIKQG